MKYQLNKSYNELNASEYNKLVNTQYNSILSKANNFINQTTSISNNNNKFIQNLLTILDKCYYYLKIERVLDSYKCDPCDLRYNVIGAVPACSFFSYNFLQNIDILEWYTEITEIKLFLNSLSEDNLNAEEFINKVNTFNCSLLSLTSENGLNSTNVDSSYKKLLSNFNTMIYDDYLKTDHWNYFRKLALLNADNKCQLCGNTNSKLHVHHNNYNNLGRETFYDIVVLYEECHAKFHSKK